MSFLVVGAGFTGAVIAERIASQLGKRVLLIDKRPHIAGNAFDKYDEHGVLIHQYGPHIFHTNSPRIAEYLSNFTEWRPYEHRVVGLVNGDFVPLPFNLVTMEIVFGKKNGRRLGKILTDEFGSEVKVTILKMRQSTNSQIRALSDLIYEKVFLHYTQKQWGLRPEELDPLVTDRVPVHLSRDDRYFQDSFQAMPAAGYASLFQKILGHPLIEIRTGMDYASIIQNGKFHRVVFTGPIDEFFDAKHGFLPYRSIKFEWKTTQSNYAIQQAATMNYPTPHSLHSYTRSTEFRLLTGQQDINYTTQAYEYPEPYVSGVNEPYYPIPREDNRELYRRYQDDAQKLKTVFFAGRLADYNYYNMDQAVGRALACFEKQIVPSLFS